MATAPTTTTALDVPRDIAGAIRRWARDGRAGPRRRQRLAALEAMANGNGRTDAEHVASIAKARAYVAKHEADMVGPPNALRTFDNGTAGRFGPRTPRARGRSVAERRCAKCGRYLPKAPLTGGRPRKFCSDACADADRARRYRARRARAYT